MGKDEIIEIVFNFEELLEEVEKLSKEYVISTGLRRMLIDRDLNSQDPWFKFKNNKWAIFLAKENYLYTNPYSIICERYLQKKKENE